MRIPSLHPTVDTDRRRQYAAQCTCVPSVLYFAKSRGESRLLPIVFDPWSMGHLALSTRESAHLHSFVVTMEDIRQSVSPPLLSQPGILYCGANTISALLLNFFKNSETAYVKIVPGQLEPPCDSRRSLPPSHFCADKMPLEYRFHHSSAFFRVQRLTS